MKIGDLVRTKSPFEPEICLVVDIVSDRYDNIVFEVLAPDRNTTYNLRKASLEVISERV